MSARRASALKRLWQPRRPLFWLMLTFNALSSGLAGLMRVLPLGDLGVLALGLLALMNVGMGMWAMALLLRLPRGTADDPT